jgi:hypothetical protein
VPVDIFVAVLQTKDGKLLLKVIPLIDADSIKQAEWFRRQTVKASIIGEAEEGKAKVNNDTELTDDEI